ncbi:MAG: type VI secretion system tip protein TssI/VgrG [Polyangiaceae bacterium]
MNIGLSFVKLRVGGATYRVSELEGREGVSSLFSYAIGFPAPAPFAAPDEIVGAEATLVLEDRIGNAREVRGRVAWCDTAGGEGSGELAVEVRLELRPLVYDLTLGRSSRTFQSKTLKQILGEVLGASGSTTLAFPDGPEIPYRVQRAESDWSFVERTLADAGLVYFFDHAGGSSLVIAERPDVGGFIEGKSLPVHIGSMIGAVAEGVIAMGRVGAASTTAHTMKGFRWENPSLGVAAAVGAGPYESYDRVLEVPGLNDIGPARAAAAAGRASSGRVVGTARTVRLYPGMSFTTEEGGDVVVHETEVSIEDAELGDESSAVVVAFSSAAAGSGALPARDPAPRTHGGLSLAIVAADAGDEVYPEAKGRVRAQHHWDRSGRFDAGSGTWLRPTQRLAPGSMMFPRTGWVVAAMGQCGDGDSPIALGRIHDGDHPPSYSLPENKTRVVYKTATVPAGGTFNEIHFEDKKGAEVMYIHASKNTDVLTKQFKTERVLNDASHTVDGEQRLTHGDALDTKVDLVQTIAIGHDEIVKTGGSFSKTVSGNETIRVAERRNIAGELSHSTRVTKKRRLTVGAALIDISLGQINRSARNALTIVGGLVLRLTAQSLQRTAGPVWLETVGGLKYARSGLTLTDAAAKDFVETAGGSITLTAGTNVNEDCDNEASWIVAGAFEANADEAYVEGHQSIDIVCGKSLLHLDEKGLVLKSTEIALDGGALEVLTGIVSHN